MFSEHYLKQVERELAAYIGPIATVVVARAARRVRKRSQLLNVLSAELEDADERLAFMRAIQELNLHEPGPDE